MNKGKGRKRSKDSGSWAKNVAKKARNQGDGYVSVVTKNPVPEKSFKEVLVCSCTYHCSTSVSTSHQRAFFTSFWDLGDYAQQNVLLSTCMKICQPEEEIENRREKRFSKWSYWFPLPDNNVRVCKQFLLKVLGLGKHRLACLQKKIMDNASLSDGRGKHTEHKIKLTEEIRKLIQDHCESIPHKQSHYGKESTNLNYFENPELTLKTMYDLFIEYYRAKTGNRDVPFDLSTYSKYFNHNVNFSFRTPRVDVCNLCFENENVTPMSAEFETHKKSIDKYNELKREILDQKDVLCLEFDFAQNLPLPKLPVSEQFYRRLLWLYIFNIHVFKTDRSYIFPFIEGSLKKGGNTVINCLLYVITEELKLEYNSKIVLFSDGCGGQNRNYLIMHILSMISTKFQIPISHIYPVRGHSYCQCDRNFGLYGQKKKKIERIETADEYIELIKTSRNPPFTIVKQEALHMKNIESVELKKSKHVPKEALISKAVKIVYFPNGEIEFYSDYDGKPQSFKIDKNLTLECFENAPPPPTVGITQEKLKDIKALYRYLSATGKAFFDEYFDSASSKK